MSWRGGDVPANATRSKRSKDAVSAFYRYPAIYFFLYLSLSLSLHNIPRYSCSLRFNEIINGSLRNASLSSSLSLSLSRNDRFIETFSRIGPIHDLSSYYRRMRSVAPCKNEVNNWKSMIRDTNGPIDSTVTKSI